MTVNFGLGKSVSIAEQLAGALLVYDKPVPARPFTQVKTNPVGRVTVAVLTVCANNWLGIKSAASANSALTLPLFPTKDRRLLIFIITFRFKLIVLLRLTVWSI